MSQDGRQCRKSQQVVSARAPRSCDPSDGPTSASEEGTALPELSDVD